MKPKPQLYTEPKFVFRLCGPQISAWLFKQPSRGPGALHLVAPPRWPVEGERTRRTVHKRFDEGGLEEAHFISAPRLLSRLSRPHFPGRPSLPARREKRRGGAGPLPSSVCRGLPRAFLRLCSFRSPPWCPGFPSPPVPFPWGTSAMWSAPSSSDECVCVGSIRAGDASAVSPASQAGTAWRRLRWERQQEVMVMSACAGAGRGEAGADSAAYAVLSSLRTPSGESSLNSQHVLHSRAGTTASKHSCLSLPWFPPL